MTDPQSFLDAVDWHPADGSVLLLASDEHGIETLCALLETLPAHARGTVFVEVQHLDDAVRIDAPSRFSVRWLVRDRGQDLDRAVDAWLAEMLPGDAGSARSVYAWVASRGPARLLTAG